MKRTCFLHAPDVYGLPGVAVTRPTVPRGKGVMVMVGVMLGVGEMAISGATAWVFASGAVVGKSGGFISVCKLTGLKVSLQLKDDFSAHPTTLPTISTRIHAA